MGAGGVSELLRAYGAGDAGAFDRVVPLVYDELRRLARRHLRQGGRGATLDTTALVHEAYLKLAGAARLKVEDRGHFMAVAARAMRQVIIGRARARGAAKRGSGQAPVPLDPDRLSADEQAGWLLDLDEALERLRARDESLARVVECRFFAGLSEAETAEAVGLPLRSSQRAWVRARAFLRAEMAGEGGELG